MIYLQTNLTGECYGEDIVSFAEVIIPRIVLVYRILSSDGNAKDRIYRMNSLPVSGERN